MFASGLPEQGSFSFGLAEILDSNLFLFLSTISLLVSHPVECNPNRRGQEMTLVLPDQRLS